MLLPGLAFAIDLSLMVLIWMVQVIVYPSFLQVDLQKLQNWHKTYTQRITCFVIPLMFTQVGLWVTFTVQQGSLLTGAAMAMIALCWVSTFALSVPLHDKISKGATDKATLERLVLTNWPRTVLWSLTPFLSGLQWWTLHGVQH